LETPKQNIEEFRAECKKEAAKRGYTLEEECDEMERLTCSKAYADTLRELYGITTK
jgi:hypothetical protein